MRELVKEDLYKSGLLYGRERAAWNPKMKDYVSFLKFNERKEAIHLFNEDVVLDALKNLEGEIRQLIREDKRILFVGTKKAVVHEKFKVILVDRETRNENGEVVIVQRKMKGPVEKTVNLFREFCNSLLEIGESGGAKPKINYVWRRWVGGTLTNHRVVQKQVSKLRDMDREMEDIAEFRGKHSQAHILKTIKDVDKMRKLYGGVLTMRKAPDALFVIDAEYEKAAVREAKKMGVKVFATVNTNADPSSVDFAIPMNDESPKPLNFLFGYVRDIIKDEILHIQAENENLTVEEYLKKHEGENSQDEEVQASSSTATNKSGD